MVEITESDVVILDEVVNNNEGMATFLMFVYTKNPTDILDQEILVVHILILNLILLCTAQLMNANTRN